MTYLVGLSLKPGADYGHIIQYYYNDVIILQNNMDKFTEEPHRTFHIKLSGLT